MQSQMYVYHTKVRCDRVLTTELTIATSYPLTLVEVEVIRGPHMAYIINPKTLLGHTSSQPPLPPSSSGPQLTPFLGVAVTPVYPSLPSLCHRSPLASPVLFEPAVLTSVLRKGQTWVGMGPWAPSQAFSF
jgi:hypothetical protein